MPQFEPTIKFFPEDQKDLERLDILQGEAKATLLAELKERAKGYLQRSLRLIQEGEHQEGVTFTEKGVTLKQKLRELQKKPTRKAHRPRSAGLHRWEPSAEEMARLGAW